jgi:hypothetical protein
MDHAFAEAGMRVMFADIEAKPLEKAVAASKAICPTARCGMCATKAPRIDRRSQPF